MADGSTEIFPSEWKISDPKLIAETVTSRIYKVRLEDRGDAVIKHIKPRGEEELRSADYFRWQDSHGAIRLLDQHGPSLLLEYAGSRMLLDELNERDDATTTAIASDVILRLHAAPARPLPAALKPLKVEFASLFTKAEADRAAGQQTPFTDAAALALHLLDNQRDIRPLHGDLHHENILLGDRGWLAIDPKGFVGDKIYDYANMFYNPLERHDLNRSHQRTADMAQEFARSSQRDIRTILQFAFAYGCLSASWHFEDQNRTDMENDLATAETVRTVLTSIA